MQLSQPEALGLLHQHHARVGHIDADFDHRGRNQNLHLAFLEALHHGFLLGRCELAVHQTDGQHGEDLARKVLVHLLRGFHGLRFRFLDYRVDHVRLAAFVDLSFHETVSLLDPVGGCLLYTSRCV